MNVSMRKIERRKEGIRGNGGKLECNIWDKIVGIVRNKDVLVNF